MGLVSNTAEVAYASISFSAIADVPLGHLALLATDSAIVFRGEKIPALEQIAAIKAKEILDGHLAAARARKAAAAEAAVTPNPRPVGMGDRSAAVPDEVRGRTRSRTAQLRRDLSASIAVGSSEDPLEE